MKTLFAILCTIALVLASGVKMAAGGFVSSAPSVARCACPCCQGPSCCCANDAQPDAPTPALPVSLSASLDWSLLLQGTVSILLPVPPPLPSLAAALRDVQPVLAVPRYARDCARLI